MVKRKCYILLFKDSDEYNASEKTALDMAKAIKDLFKINILKLNNRNWVQKLTKINKNNLCLLATHGGIGENGILQLFLESKKIKYTHSNSGTCAILSNKHITKLIYNSLKIPTPSWYFRNAKFGKNKIKEYVIKKPISGGSKQGVKIIKIPKTLDGDHIYEQLIGGDLEVSVSILGSKRAIALEPIVRRRAIGKLKRSNIKLNKVTLSACKDMAYRIHKELDCYGVTKTDFLIDTKNKIWAIETDTIPGLAKDNATALAANISGISYKELILKIIQDVN